MFKPILQLAAVGVAGFALWKLGSVLFLPLFFLALKVALAVGLVLFVFWFFNKKSDKGDTPAE